MPKKINNKSLFLNTVQKVYNISEKEMAESEIWIDGFKNALKSAEKVGMFSEWQPIETAPFGDYILIFGKGTQGDGLYDFEIGFKNYKGQFLVNKENDNLIEFINATHWLPIPHLPITK